MAIQLVHRHPDNPNLHCMQAAFYEGLPIYPEQGPFIQEYLQRAYAILDHTLEQSPDAYALCFSLWYPKLISEEAYGNGVLSEFWRLLKVRIQTDAQALGMPGVRVRYVWSRVQTDTNSPHYRCCLFLPRGLYRSVGAFNPAEVNLHHHLCSAWAAVLGLELHLAAGLVKTPRNSQFYISRSHGVEELWRLVSQLCSTYGKHFGSHCHWFDCSCE